MLETITLSKRLSARLRSEITDRCGVALVNALQDYLTAKDNGDFDSRRPWQIMEVLELSELAHRLQDLANLFDQQNIVDLELVRLSRDVFADYRRVYDMTMYRTLGQPSMEFTHKPNENDNRGNLTIID